MWRAATIRMRRARLSKSDRSHRKIGLGSMSSAMSGRALPYVDLCRPIRCFLPLLAYHRLTPCRPFCQLRLRAAAVASCASSFRTRSSSSVYSPLCPLLAPVPLLRHVCSRSSTRNHPCGHSHAHHLTTTTISLNSTLSRLAYSAISMRRTPPIERQEHRQAPVEG